MAGTAQDKQKEFTFGQLQVGINENASPHGTEIDTVKNCIATVIDKMNDLRQTKYEQDDKGKDNLDKPIQNGEQKMAADMAIQSLIVAHDNAIRALDGTN